MTWWQRGVGALICAALLAAGIWYWRQSPAPDVPAVVTKTADSLVATEGVFDSATTTAIAGVDRQAEADRRLARRERALQALADSLRARKDSLAVAAAQHPDSALAWRAAYVAADSEATSLRTVIDTLHTRIDTLTAARDTARAVATRALDRLHVAQDVVTDLRAAIAKMNGRTLWDYVSVGCGMGFKGPDCYVGARIPIGRPRK